MPLWHAARLLVKALAVIPARYASSRLPGKPLIPLAGKPMIQHVWERACRAENISRVLVATDDDRILQAVRGFGGEAVMTRPDHPSGTARVAEVAAHAGADIVINIQGDEPLLDPAAISSLLPPFDEQSVSLATLCTPIREHRDIMDPNIVKVVLDFQGDALYFSRAPIPWVRGDGRPSAPRHLKHLGLYAARRETLLEFLTLPHGELETLEQLEQLRWLENGYRIRVVETAYDSVSVDVPDDIPRVEKLLREIPTEKSASSG